MEAGRECTLHPGPRCYWELVVIAQIAPITMSLKRGILKEKVMINCKFIWLFCYGFFNFAKKFMNFVIFLVFNNNSI